MSAPFLLFRAAPLFKGGGHVMCCFVSVVHHMKASVLEGLLYLTSFFPTCSIGRQKHLKIKRQI